MCVFSEDAYAESPGKKSFLNLLRRLWMYLCFSLFVYSFMIIRRSFIFDQPTNSVQIVSNQRVSKRVI